MVDQGRVEHKKTKAVQLTGISGQTREGREAEKRTQIKKLRARKEGISGQAGKYRTDKGRAGHTRARAG